MLSIIQISKMLHFMSLHLQSRLIKQQNLGATLELLKLSKTPMVLNLQKKGVLKHEGKDNDGVWIVAFN